CAWRRRVTASLSLLSTARLAALGLRRWRAAARDRNLAAVSETHKTGGDDPLVRLEAGLYNSLDFIPLLHRDLTHDHCTVILDDVNEGAIGSALHRTGRDHHDLFEGVDEQTDVDELAGPELQILIREFGFELHGAGGLIDLVVDYPEQATIDHSVGI